MREPRQIILRLLLWSLAAAAVAGVLAVLLPRDEIMMRVMFTGFATALAGGLCLPLSLLIDRARTRRAGLFGVAIVVVEFLLALISIWLEDVISNRVSEDIGVSAALAGFVGAVVLGFLMVTGSRTSRLAGWTGVVTATAMFVAFMIAVWLPGSFWRHDEWWSTGWTLGGVGDVAAGCLAGLGAEDGLRKWWRWVGVICALIATCFFLVAIWDVAGSEKAIALSLAASIAASHANLLGLGALKHGQRWVRVGTVAAAIATGLFINVLVVTDGGIATDLWERLTAAAGIVTACGTLAVIVLLAFNRRGDIERDDDVPVTVSLVCPRCREDLEAPVGKSRCPACDLRMDLRIEQPRCPDCGYLLYQLQSNTCPECGRDIRRTE